MSDLVKFNPKTFTGLFPYFGGKGRVADDVWSRFGSVQGYIEPFSGSAAVMFKNPNWRALKSETINDLDGFICNFWRSAAMYPDEVAAAADWPVSHIDLSSRHRWLVDHRAELTEALIADIDYCDPKIAGVWLWGICQWIGGDWCKGDCSNKRPHLADHGRGIHSLGKRPHLGDHGMGVHSLGKRPHLANHGMGGFYDEIKKVSQRLRNTRITCCDWTSLKSTTHPGIKKWAVFLDPPYTDRKRDSSLYGATEDYTVADEAFDWAIELGEQGHFVAFCGQYQEHEFPDDWEVYSWDTMGYSYGDRDRRECLWFSPACEANKKQSSLF